jgi:arabinofuranan 3-O-arabinosyltransferase
VVATTYPFWIGGLYGRGGQTKPTSVPSYYPASFSWLDAHLGDARALILPGTANSWYRWGFVGDDIVNAYMRHQYVLRGLLPFSNSEADSIVTAIDDRVNNGTLEPGMIAPIARRLGIRYIMLRNDLDWRKSERPRPVLLDALRHDPEIFRVATFGSPGQNVTDPGDTSVEARAEHKLPPVEIYQVWAPSDPPRVVSAQKPLLLAGDGAAWPLLARNEALTPSAAVISTRDLTRNQLAGALRNGANVAITDTNRRTSTFVTQTSQQTSYTLGRSEVQKRGMAATTDPTRSQSVATFSDASDIREISPTSRSAPDTRPALAFDGDRRTAWLADAFAPPDARLRIELRAPHVVSHVDLVAARLLGTGRELTGVDIRFSDGSSVPVGLENRSVSVDFAPRRVSWIEIAFTRVAGAGVRPIGLAEISFRNLLLGESIEVPEDVFNLAAGDPGTAQLLAQAPFRYQFERQRTSTTEVEGRLARTFRTTGTHTFTTLGTLQLDGTVRDSRVDHVLNGVSGATSSVRYDFSLANTGSNAFDGRIETGWVAPAKLGPTLYLHFPPQPVMHVAVKAHTGPGLSRLMRVRVVVGSYSREVGLVPEPACGKGAAIGLTPCELVGGIDLPAPVVGGARVVVTDFSARSGGAFGAAPVRIDEVELNGKANPAPVDTSELTGCIDDVVKVDGRSLPIALYGTRRDLLTGVSVPFTACRTLQLGPGAHTLRTGVPVNDLTFNDERAQTPPPSGSVGTISQSAAATKLQVSASAGDLLLGGFSFDRNWKATVDGHPLAGPEPVDGQSAWVVPHALEAATVQLSYRPQKTYDRALFVTLAGLVLCGGILFRTRRRRAA